MGARVNFSNRVRIGTHTWQGGPLSGFAWYDLTEEIKRTILSDPQIQYIQTDEFLPLEGLKVIDELLRERPDLTFRIYGLHSGENLDLGSLERMEHLTKLSLDIHLTDHTDLAVREMEKLCGLSGLKALSFHGYGWKEYRFVRELGKGLEQLWISADLKNGAPDFDCRWLLDFPNHHTLYLGKKAKKHIACIGEMPKLKHLSLRGIKIRDFSFLKDSKVESLDILWAGVDDLDSLALLTYLRELYLWRIPKLTDLSVISRLDHLEVLKLQDLKHVQALPDVAGLPLQNVFLSNVPINPETLPEGVEIVWF